MSFKMFRYPYPSQNAIAIWILSGYNTCDCLNDKRPTIDNIVHCIFRCKVKLCRNTITSDFHLFFLIINNAR